MRCHMKSRLPKGLLQVEVELGVVLALVLVPLR